MTPRGSYNPNENEHVNVWGSILVRKEKAIKIMIADTATTIWMPRSVCDSDHIPTRQGGDHAIPVQKWFADKNSLPYTR